MTSLIYYKFFDCRGYFTIILSPPPLKIHKPTCHSVFYPESNISELEEILESFNPMISFLGEETRSQISVGRSPINPSWTESEESAPKVNGYVQECFGNKLPSSGKSTVLCHLEYGLWFRFLLWSHCPYKKNEIS